VCKVGMHVPGPSKQRCSSCWQQLLWLVAKTVGYVSLVTPQNPAQPVA